MVGAAIGAIIGMGAGALGFTIAGFTAGTMWLAGAALGYMYDQYSSMDMNSASPTYSLGQLNNTKSQLVPIPVVYGKCRVGGNVIIQDFLDDDKEKMNMFVAVSEGPIQSISNVMANDVNPETLDDCSFSKYLGTSTQTKDSRHPSDIPQNLIDQGYTGDYKDLAYIALTLKAQKKLTGNPTISSIVEGRKVWTPEGVQYSRNPVWCLIDLLSHTRYGLGMWDESNNSPNWDLIDYDTAVYSATYCDQIVGDGPRFTLDYVVDVQKSCIDIIKDILSNFRGFIVARDKLEIHVDRPSTVYKYVDQSDILEGSFSWEQKSGEDMPNRFVLNWINPDDHYESNAYIIEDYDRINAEGINQQQFDLLGTTRKEQVARMGAYLVDTANGVRDFCSFGLALDNADIEVGDVIGVTHDLPGWGDYDGEHASNPEKLMRVAKVEDIEESDGLEYVQVMCTEYVAEVYNDRAGDIPEKVDTGLDNPWECPNVTDVLAEEFIQVHSDGMVTSNIDITWQDPNVMLSGVEILLLEEGESLWNSFGIVSPGIENFVIRNIRSDQTITVKIVAINTKYIKASGVAANVTLYGKALPPGPPTNLAIAGGAQHIAISWDNPSDFDFSHVDIVEYKGTAQPGDVSLGTIVASISGNSFTRGGLDDLQTYWYWVRSVDTSGNTSDWVGPMSGVTKNTEIPEITETMIADDAISTPKLQTNAITSSVIASNAVTSDKINVANLSAINADMGTLIAGIAKSADGKIQLDLNNKRILVYDASGTLRVRLGAL